MTGRRPKPNTIHIIRATKGTPGRRPLHATDIVAPPLPENASAPKWLSADARLEWQRVVKVLAHERIVTVLDVDVIALYCATFATWKTATAAMEAEPVVVTKGGNVKASPHHAIATASARALLKLAIELGLTPSARSRIARVANPEPPNPLNKFLR